MARTDKDNPGKERALKFCVSSGLLPFLEVDLHTGVEFSAAPRLLTDIDVLGIHLREDGTVARTIFDCKGTGGPPFARSLWLSGLMTYVEAEEGVIIMGRPAEKAHRLAARRLNVRIFGMNSFDDYAGAANPEYKILESYAGRLENWHRIADASKEEASVKAIYQGIHQEVPTSLDAPKSLRRLISKTLQHKGELNPKKPLHMAVFTELVLSVSYLLGSMASDIRNTVDLSDGEREFATALRYYTWGGYENVENLKKMYELLSASDREYKPETELVAWPHLIQLVRGLLEAPTYVRNSSLALRDLSLLYLADRDEAADLRAARMFSEPRARQFAKRFGDYTASVMKLPQEFPDRMGQQIDELVSSTANRRGP